MVFHRDFLLRMIEESAAALARALLSSEEGNDAVTREEVDEAYGALLDTRRELFERLDSESAGLLLAQPERIRAVANVCRVDGELLAKQGETDRSEERFVRALELYLEALEGSDRGTLESVGFEPTDGGGAQTGSRGPAPIEGSTRLRSARLPEAGTSDPGASE